MHSMRLSIPIILLVTICFAHVAAQAADNPCRGPDRAKAFVKAQTAPIEYTAASVTTNIQRGAAGLTVTAGFNLIGAPQRMTCHNEAGCLLTGTTMVMPVDPGGAFVCTFVDGAPLGPPPPQPIVGYLNYLQSGRVEAGSHTIETKVFVESDTTLLPWELQFTLYDN